MENNKNKNSVKFQGDVLNFCDFIQVFEFTTNHHLKHISTVCQQPAKLNLHTCCVATRSKQQSAFSILPIQPGYGDMDFFKLVPSHPSKFGLPKKKNKLHMGCLIIFYKPHHCTKLPSRCQ